MANSMKNPNTPRGLYKRGDVYYSRIAGIDGKLIRQVLSADKQTAIIMLGEMRKKIELQRVGILPDTMSQEVKLSSQIKKMYHDRLRALGRSVSTLNAFQLSWKYVVEDSNLDFVSQITVAKAQEFAERRRAKGTRGQTINHYVSFVKDALDWARDFEYITKNPLARWEPVKKDTPRKRRDMSEDEIQRFFQAETDENFQLLWLVYFSTGLRVSAGLNMEWEWIRWDEQAMVLPAKSNKSGIDHWIHLNPHLFSELKRKRDSLPEGAATGRLFKPMLPRELYNRFRHICGKAHIDIEGLCPHSIRHTYATGSYKASGKNLKVVQELLCHANVATTSRYVHATAEEKRAVNDAYGAIIANQFVGMKQEA
ncbi:MAG: tyrosine-type recombinase/integrase [Planctomycetes bacterium]|nr:tyrosine-type recombinase/integrase [Planctomycetota bacterium]